MGKLLHLSKPFLFDSDDRVCAVEKICVNKFCVIITHLILYMPLHHRIPADEKLSVNTVDNGHMYSIARNVNPAVVIIPEMKLFPQISRTL